jgi:hypothetical protein
MLGPNLFGVSGGGQTPEIKLKSYSVHMNALAPSTHVLAILVDVTYIQPNWIPLHPHSDIWPLGFSPNFVLFTQRPSYLL